MPNSMGLSVPIVPWFLPLIIGSKGERKDRNRGREMEREAKKEIESVETEQFQVHSVGQTEHSVQCINMGLNNSNFQTAGRGFPVGGKKSP